MDKRFLRFAMFIVLVLGCGKNADSETKTINGIECVLVKAETGTLPTAIFFRMGDDGRTVHKVTLTKDFWISKYEVTQAQYKAAMGTNPSYFKGDNLPVEKVSYDEAVAFCKKVGGRLPTEAEWEFAARGGNKSEKYKYSGSNNLDVVAWHKGNSDTKTHPVGQKAPNELGIYDMSGNVWEWCSDWYGDYPSDGSVEDPTGPVSGSYRVNRGGGFNNTDYCRVVSRGWYLPSNNVPDLGFRVVFDAELEKQGNIPTPQLGIQAEIQRITAEYQRTGDIQKYQAEMQRIQAIYQAEMQRITAEYQRTGDVQKYQAEMRRIQGY